MTNGPITQMPGKRTNKDYQMQGWNAAIAGFTIDQSPYYETSTADKYWRKGFRMA